MPLVTDLKKQGKVRYIGITSIRSSQYPQPLEYMRKYPMDFLQVNYSLGDRSAEAEVLPLAQERKIAVMAAVPLGGVANLLIKQTGDRQLPSWAAQFGIASWSQFFLKYVYLHPAISCAIPRFQQARAPRGQSGGRTRPPAGTIRKPAGKSRLSGRRPPRRACTIRVREAHAHAVQSNPSRQSSGSAGSLSQNSAYDPSLFWLRPSMFRRAHSGTSTRNGESPSRANRILS